MKLSEYVNRERRNVFVSEPYNSLSSIYAYNNFLSQELNLGMFVPCVEVKGKLVVLEEPIDPCKNNTYCIDFCQGKCQEDYNEDIKEYQEAKERCLFKGVGFTKRSTYFIIYDSDYPEHKIWLSWNKSKTIEDIIEKVELTEKVKKQYGL